MAQLQTSIQDLQSVYENTPNFRTLAGSGTTGYVFFSGNGLYFPNTDDEFRRVVIENNRFEWTRLIPDSKYYSKAIFLRDVKKTWYVDGISKEHDSVDKVLELLKQEFAGIDEIICVGNSAGGYAATLFGALLGAKQVFSISGFFQLTKEQVNNPINPYLQMAQQNPEKNKWFDLIPVLKRKCAANSAINFIYSVGCSEDVEQATIGTLHSGIRLFPIQSERHGKNIPGFAYPTLIRTKQEKLDQIRTMRGIVAWPPKLFAYKVLGPLLFINALASQFFRKLLTSRAP